MRYLIKENPDTSPYRWDCQYKDYQDFDTKEEAIAYCQELFGDDDFILLEAAE